MNWQLIIFSLFFFIVFTQNVTSCTSPPLKMQLVAPTYFILYYQEYKNCNEKPQVIYCELAYCRLKFNEICYQYSLQIELNELKCKQKCCQGVKKYNLQLYNGLECVSVVQNMKKSMNSNTTSNVKEITIDSQSQDSKQIEPSNNNNNTYVQSGIRYEVIIFVSCWVVVILIPLCVCCCKCYNSWNSALVVEGMPQPQINSQRALNPIRDAAKQMNSKSWRLPDQYQLLKQTKLRQQECIICINGPPNCSLSCGHIYHKPCIYKWLQKVFCCPLCKSKAITNLTVRCTRCLTQRYDCLIGQMKGSFFNEDICSSCLMAQI